MCRFEHVNRFHDAYWRPWSVDIRKSSEHWRCMRLSACLCSSVKARWAGMKSWGWQRFKAHPVLVWNDYDNPDHTDLRSIERIWSHGCTTTSGSFFRTRWRPQHRALGIRIRRLAWRWCWRDSRFQIPGCCLRNGSQVHSVRLDASAWHPSSTESWMWQGLQPNLGS